MMIFKNHGKQNQDPTLREKRWTLFKAGRQTSYSVLILGTLAAFMLSTFIINLIETMVVALIDPIMGVMPSMVNSNSTLLEGLITNSIFRLSVFFSDNNLLASEQVFGTMILVNHGKQLTTFMRVIAFIFMEREVFTWFINLYTKSRDLNNNEYGDDRIATVNEVKSETIKVPDRFYEYDSSSGVIAMHEFNWRGRVNKLVKQQYWGIKKTLRLTDSDIVRFELIAKSFLLLIVTGLIVGTIIDSDKPVNVIPWYSPYMLILTVKDIFHFFFTMLDHLRHFIWNIQTSIPKYPIYFSVPILTIEAGGIGYLLFKVLPDFVKSQQNGVTLALISNVFIKQQDRFKKSRKDTDNSEVVKKKRRVEKNQYEPVSVTLNKFFQNPLISFKFVALNMAETLLPLEHGVTGYYYLNPKPQNTITYGITRSGKGQMLVNPSIDVAARAQNKVNMINNDPKGELAAGSYQMLREHGYNVQILNIMDMSHSMSYNPLFQVINSARCGDMGKAGTQCSGLSYTLYDPSTQGENSYFYTSAANLFDAIVFGLLALAHSQYYGDVHPELSLDHTTDKNAWDQVTISNILQMTSQLGGESAQVKGSQDPSNRLIIYFTHLSHELEKIRKKYSEKHLDDIEMDHLNLLDQAVQKFQQSKMAGSKTAGNIYSTFLEGLRIYQQPEVAKMTSMNSLDIEQLGFDRLLTLQFYRALKLQHIDVQIKAAEKVESESDQVQDHYRISDEVIEKMETHLSDIGMAKIPIEKSINHDHFYISIKLHDERVVRDYEWDIFCQKEYYEYDEVQELKKDYRQSPKVADLDLTEDKSVIDHYTEEPVMKGVSMRITKKPELREFSEDIIGASELNILSEGKLEALRGNQLKFLYDDRPTALFFVTPPNKRELNQLCTFMINQTFDTLSELALKFTRSGSIQRNLEANLDEVGNLPAITKLDTKLSIGLSQGISFHLYFQDKEQATSIYKKEVTDIIIANCATTYYILSKSEATIKEVSDGFGERTVTSTSLNHDPTKLTSANYNESEISQKVMTTGTLRNLRIGEAAILRSNDRSSIWGTDTKPLPIFDTGNYILPYAYWFLNNSFRQNVLLGSLPVITPHKYLNLEEMTISFNDIYLKMEAQERMDTLFYNSMISKVSKVISDADCSFAIKKDYNDRLTLITENHKDEPDVLQMVLDLEKEFKGRKGLVKLDEIRQVSEYMLDRIQSSEQPLGNAVENMEFPSRLAHISASINGGLVSFRPMDIYDMNEVVQVNDELVLLLENANSVEISETNSRDEKYIALFNNIATAFITYFAKRKLLSFTDVEPVTMTKFGNDFFKDSNTIVEQFVQNNPFGSDKYSSINANNVLQEGLKIMYEYFNGNIDDHEVELRGREYVGFFFIKRIINNEIADSLFRGNDGKEAKATMFIFVSYVMAKLDIVVSMYQQEIASQNGEEEQNVELTQAYSDLMNTLIDIDKGLPIK